MLSISDVASVNDYCFGKADELLPRLHERVFSNIETDDLITPFTKGREWTFSYLCNYQPKTAALLLSGGEFRFVAKKMDAFPNGTGQRFNTNLIQEVNGQVVEIRRRFWGQNPDDPDYQANIEKTNAHLTKAWGYPRRTTQRQLSLPDPIRLAYYHRIDGLRIPDSPAFGIYGRILPFSSAGEWQSIDGYLGDLRLKKKLLPVVEEMIPGIKPDEKDMPYINFMMFLNSWGSFTGKKKTDGDHLFVKNHIQDGVVYYIRDADVANMMILADPAEAIDCYCEHVLLRKEERFDFRPWAMPFEEPSTS